MGPQGLLLQLLPLAGKETVNANGFRQFIPYRRQKQDQHGVCSPWPLSHSTALNRRGPLRDSRVSQALWRQGLFHWEANTKLQPSGLADGHRIRRLWPRVSEDGAKLMRNCLVAASHQTAYLHWLQQKLKDAVPRLCEDCGPALPTEPQWRHVGLHHQITSGHLLLELFPFTPRLTPCSLIPITDNPTSRRFVLKYFYHNFHL